MNFGHLEVLHSKFHDPTISNLGDQSGQTNKQTNTQTNKETNRHCDIYSRYFVKDESLEIAHLDTQKMLQLQGASRLTPQYYYQIIINVIDILVSPNYHRKMSKNMCQITKV